VFLLGQMELATGLFSARSGSTGQKDIVLLGIL
jgi:hypothetical protein